MAATIASIASVMPGLAIDGMATCLGVAGVFAVVHSVLRPVLRSPTRPLLIAVGGIGSLALDAVILVVLARLLDGVRLDGFAALRAAPWRSRSCPLPTWDRNLRPLG